MNGAYYCNLQVLHINWNCYKLIENGKDTYDYVSWYGYFQGVKLSKLQETEKMAYELVRYSILPQVFSLVRSTVTTQQENLPKLETAENLDSHKSSGSAK